MSTTAAAETRTKFDRGAFVRQYAIVGILVLFVLGLSLATGGKFLQAQNLLNVVTQVAAIGIIAIGMTFVIITLGIDLSVGSLLAVAAVVATRLAQIPSGTAKFLISVFKIAPFIATLGMMSAARGLALIYSDGRPISRLDPGFNFLGQGSIIGIPVPIIIFAVVAVAAHVVLNYTRFGRHVYAIGGNEQAARVSGINIKRATIIIYTLCGLLAGIAGIISAGRIGSGNPQLGTGIELGGTSFKGGIGTIWGTVIGALIIQSLNTGLVLLGMNDFVQMVVKGAIIIIAVILDERKNR